MKHFFVLLIAITIFSCRKDDDFKPDEPVVIEEAQTLKDVAYGNDKLQKMDFYLPAGRSTATTKVIILLHGGAWAEGDKADLNSIIDSLRKRLPDWAFFNLNYRLASFSGNKFPTQEEDVKSAVKYIYDRRQTFGLSDKWVMAGASAGAHLAMLQAYKNNQTITPKAVVNFFGPVDMAALYNFYVSTDPGTAFLVSFLMGGTPASNASMYQSGSPIHFVSAQSPPTIILQGGLDDVVPKEQSYTLEAKLKSFNVKNQLVYYPAQTHGWSDPAIWNDCLNKIQNFLNENVP
jgi:acetyl esterase/lipase